MAVESFFRITIEKNMQVQLKNGMLEFSNEEHRVEVPCTEEQLLQLENLFQERWSKVIVT